MVVPACLLAAPGRGNHNMGAAFSTFVQTLGLFRKWQRVQLGSVFTYVGVAYLPCLCVNFECDAFVFGFACVVHFRHFCKSRMLV